MPIRLTSSDRFANRHIGPSDQEIQDMLRVVGAASLDELIDQTVPRSIRMEGSLNLPAALTERELLQRATELAGKNKVYRSYIGMGYSGTVTPPAIQRGCAE